MRSRDDWLNVMKAAGRTTFLSMHKLSCKAAKGISLKARAAAAAVGPQPMEHFRVSSIARRGV